MKKIQISMISISMLDIIFEILPFGVKCTFMDEGHVEIVRTYSVSIIIASIIIHSSIVFLAKY